MNDDQFGASLEDIDHKIDGVFEAVVQMQDQVKKLPTQDEFNELKADVQTVEHSVAEQEQRLSHLETT